MIGCLILCGRSTGRRLASSASSTGPLLGIAAFAFTSLVFGLVLPEVPEATARETNDPVTVLLVGATAYAMARHRLMDIRFVVLRGVTYAVLLLAAGAALVGFGYFLNQPLANRLGVDHDTVLP